MNADQARQLSEKGITQTGLGYHYQKIMEIIDKATKTGERHVWYYSQVPDATKMILINDGFILSDESLNRNEYLIRIKW